MCFRDVIDLHLIITLTLFIVELILNDWYKSYNLDPGIPLQSKYIGILLDALGLTSYMSEACFTDTAPYTAFNEGWNIGMVLS